MSVHCIEPNKSKCGFQHTCSDNYSWGTHLSGTVPSMGPHSWAVDSPSWAPLQESSLAPTGHQGGSVEARWHQEGPASGQLAKDATERPVSRKMRSHKRSRGGSTSKGGRAREECAHVVLSIAQKPPACPPSSPASTRCPKPNTFMCIHNLHVCIHGKSAFRPFLPARGICGREA